MKINKGKIIKIGSLIIGIVVLLTISLVLFTIGFFSGTSADMDQGKKVSVQDLLKDKDIKFYFNHGEQFNGQDIKAKPINPKIFLYSYSQNKTAVSLVTGKTITEGYLSKIRSNKENLMEGYHFNDKGSDYFYGSVKNTKGDKLEWDKDKNNYGNLKIIKTDGKAKDLLKGGKYTISNTPVVPNIQSVSFLTDDLIIIEIRGNLQLKTLVDNCRKENWISKISMRCSSDNIYNQQLNSYKFDSSLFENQFAKYYTDCDSSGCIKYDQYNSIVILDVNSGNWSEVTLGNNPLTF